MIPAWHVILLVKFSRHSNPHYFQLDMALWGYSLVIGPSCGAHSPDRTGEWIYKWTQIFRSVGASFSTSVIRSLWCVPEPNVSVCLSSLAARYSIANLTQSGVVLGWDEALSLGWEVSSMPLPIATPCGCQCDRWKVYMLQILVNPSILLPQCIDSPTVWANFSADEILIKT